MRVFCWFIGLLVAYRHVILNVRGVLVISNPTHRCPGVKCIRRNRWGSPDYSGFSWHLVNGKHHAKPLAGNQLPPNKNVYSRAWPNFRYCFYHRHRPYIRDFVYQLSLLSSFKEWTMAPKIAGTRRTTHVPAMCLATLRMMQAICRKAAAIRRPLYGHHTGPKCVAAFRNILSTTAEVQIYMRKVGYQLLLHSTLYRCMTPPSISIAIPSVKVSGVSL